MKQTDQNEIAGILRQAVERALELVAHAPKSDDPAALFHSLRAEALKREIVTVGKKLWTREYVDGNGGNISARLTDRYVLCTPTLISKGDLTPEDICLVDMANGLACGAGAQTSEVLLHLEIYKQVPQAMAVVHCHPPHATAHAIAGLPPPPHLLPEQEIFIGPVAISAYDTPGTASFAKSVLPFIETHRTILLANHGVVSWADTVTYAEWAVEILETYCKTAYLAHQLNPALTPIPAAKLPDLLAVKRQLGFPDPRFAEQPAASARRTESAASIAVHEVDTEHLVQSLTRQLMTFIAGRA